MSYPANRKPRTIVCCKATAVLSERPDSRTVKRRGVPAIVRYVVTTYQLACGNTTTRETARNKPPPEVGKKLRCEACTAARLGKAVACG